MRISPIRINHIKFGQKNNAQYTGDVLTRDIIRERLEERYLGGFTYAHQISNKTAQKTIQEMSQKASRHSNLDGKNQSGVEVDYKKLEDLKCFCRPKRKNELYSGARLLNTKDGVKIASEAGIKTILFLNRDLFGEYEKEAKKYGLGFSTIDKIGNGTLTPNCVVPIPRNGELLKELYRHPDIWVTRDENGDIKKDADKNILDLQMFFDILDGNNKNYPTPIYYGCDFGSESTSVWTDVYMLLRNQDKTKPLSADIIAKLIKIEDECADY